MFYVIFFINIFNFATSEVHWYEDPTFRLARREGVAVGYTRELNLFLGKTHVIKTLSLEPVIFEVKNFLTPEECNYLIHLAYVRGLKDSPTHPQAEYFQTTYDVFSQWDVNNDTYVEPIEFTYIPGKGDIYLTKEDILQMMSKLNIDKNGDTKMDFNEFVSTTAERIKIYFTELFENNPSLRSRLSKQAWLWHYTGDGGELIEQYHERLSKLTLLPRDIIETSEPMQVVNYQDGDHYHCHQDSDEIYRSSACCTYQKTHENKDICRQCRYLTVMFFLNNVTIGGETAFQLADNETFSIEAWEDEAPTKCDLGKYCHNSNLVIQPVQGTALMWYNHGINAKTGWLGGLDPMTFHGGCNVILKEKWIANSWVNIIGEKNSKESAGGWSGLNMEKKEL